MKYIYVKVSPDIKLGE